VNTRAIAEQLKKKLDADPERFAKIEVFYDHGDPKRTEVCQPTTYMGRRYGRDATLSGVDIVVTKGREVILAIEVEESTVRPNKGVRSVLSLFEVVGA